MSIAPWGGVVATQRFALTVPEPPKIDQAKLNDPLPLAQSLVFPIDKADVIYDYVAQANQKQTACEVGSETIDCPTDALGLIQGQTYAISLDRYFADHHVGTIVEDEVSILPAVTIDQSSIAHDSMVYDKPLGLTLTASKPLRSISANLIDETSATVDLQEVIIDQSLVHLNWGVELPRQRRYTLLITQAEAVDGSSLAGQHVIAFSLSGGPRVAGVSIGKTGVALGSSAVVSFDQELAPGQDWDSFVSVTGGANLAQRGKYLTVSLRHLSACTPFTITVSKGILSRSGLPGAESWQYSSRTVCHSTFSIGSSSQGRAIMAHSFGTGSSVILYTATLHGNEVSAKRLMDAWINELEANVERIPAGRKVVVIPVLNPDGYALGTRPNARGVDLNRNWDVSDWQSNITDTGNNPIAGGGGLKPMSEPETQVLAKYTRSVRPRLTMSFHAQASVVIANQAADSTSIASQYARTAGYSHGTGLSSSIFAYQITGTYDDWIAEELGLASVLVELSSRTDPQWARNRPALWSMLDL